MHNFGSFLVFSFSLLLHCSINKLQFVIQPHPYIQVNNQFQGNWTGHNTVCARFCYTVTHSIHKVLFNTHAIFNTVKLIIEDLLTVT